MSHSVGTFTLESYCLCGGTMKTTGAGTLEAVTELRAIWLQVHTGPGHGAATPRQAARARAKHSREQASS